MKNLELQFEYEGFGYYLKKSNKNRYRYKSKLTEHRKINFIPIKLDDWEEAQRNYLSSLNLENREILEEKVVEEATISTSENTIQIPVFQKVQNEIELKEELEEKKTYEDDY
jgi:hypothetical protein